MNRLLCRVACLAVPRDAATGTDRADPEQDFPIPPAAKAVLDAFEKPLHPILGSVAPGGGVAFGLGYDTPRSQDWFHNASAKMTFSRYWAVEAETGYQTHKSRLGLFGSARNMNELDFFGMGSSSARDHRSSYRLREMSFGTRGWFRPRPDLRLGGIAQVYSPALGVSSDPPKSIEKIFAPADVPGFGADPLFTRYRGYIELTHPTMADPASPDATYHGHQATYQLAVETVRDHDGGRFNFHRMEAGGAGAICRREARTAADAPWTDRRHQSGCGGAVLPAVHARRQQPGRLPARHDRLRRHQGDAAQLPELPLPRPRSPADAGGISNSAEERRGRHGVLRRGPGGGPGA